MKKDSIPFRIALYRARRHDDQPQPLCLDRQAEFSDYEESPDEPTARAMCVDCPLLAVCLESAMQSKPDWGVWGGIAWDQGRQVHWLRRFGIQP